MSIASLADIEAMEQVSYEDRNFPESTYAAICQGAAYNPDKPALRFFLRAPKFSKSYEYNYRDTLFRVHQVANMFSDLGIGKDDVISFLLPNLPQTFFLILGAEAVGVVNPINPLLEPKIIADIMKAAGSKVLVSLAPLPKTDIWQKTVEIAQQVPTLETIVQVTMEDYLPGPVRWAIDLYASHFSRKAGDSGVPVINFDATANKYPGDALTAERKIAPEDLAALFHTGGTTSAPKLTAHTHANEVYSSWSLSILIENFRDKTIFCGLPLFHVSGFMVCCLMPLSVGATVVIGTPAGFRGDGMYANFWKILEHYQINVFAAVPAVYGKLAEVPVGDANFEHLDFGVCGASAMPVETFHRFESRTGIKILEGYGLTEATSVCCANLPAGERKVGSIGFRLPYTEIKVVQLDAGGKYLRDCQADETGTIIVRGPHVFPGYRTESHNEGIWIDIGDGGAPWLNTGDLGRQDADLRLWITGRQKEVIIRGGHNIDPKMIEEPLYQHEAVQLVAAVGRPDVSVGELPVVYIQLTEGADTSDAELMAYAEANIPERAAVPKEIHIIPEMPLTAVGKIFKPALVRREIEYVYQREIEALDMAENVQINAGSDVVHGILVKIRIEAPEAIRQQLREAIDQSLQRFPVKYELAFAGGN